MQIISQEQIKIALHISQTSPLDIHIDATGNCVRRMEHIKKRIYYYAGVIYLQNGSSHFLVFEMVRCQHTGYAISVWLRNVRHAFESHGK